MTAEGIGQDCEAGRRANNKRQNGKQHHTPSKENIFQLKQAGDSVKKPSMCGNGSSLRAHREQNQKTVSEENTFESDKPDGRASEEEPVCRENHAMEDHDALCHAIGSHDVDRGHGDEIEQVNIGQLERQDDIRPDNDAMVSYKVEEEHPRSANHHARDNRDASSHEVGTHVMSQNDQGETEKTEFDNGTTQSRRTDFPWTAPRIIWEFLEHDVGEDGPTIWSIDNYDGEDSWLEIGRTPTNGYRCDAEVSVNQYHKMACELHNLEGETDRLIQQQGSTTHDNQNIEE